MNRNLKIILYVILIVCVFALLFIIFINDATTDIFPEKVDTNKPIENDFNTSINPIDSSSNQQQTDPVDYKSLNVCQEDDFECIVQNILECKPSYLRFSTTSVYSTSPIYEIDVVVNYTIKGYSQTQECIVDIDYEQINFKKRDVSREDLINYFMEKYNFSEEEVNQTQIDDLMNISENESQEELLMHNNQYYDLTTKDATCMFNQETILNLLNEIFDLNSKDLSNHSLFNEDRKIETYTNCTGNLYN